MLGRHLAHQMLWIYAINRTMSWVSGARALRKSLKGRCYLFFLLGRALRDVVIYFSIGRALRDVVIYFSIEFYY